MRPVIKFFLVLSIFTFVIANMAKADGCKAGHYGGGKTGRQYTEKKIIKSLNGRNFDSEDQNNGHGNDDDHCDESNPGKSNDCDNGQDVMEPEEKNTELISLINEANAQITELDSKLTESTSLVEYLEDQVAYGLATINDLQGQIVSNAASCETDAVNAFHDGVASVEAFECVYEASQPVSYSPYYQGVLIENLGQFPDGLEILEDGTVWVADTGNKAIKTFDSNGNLVMDLRTYNFTEMNSPVSLTLDANGDMWWVDTAMGRFHQTDVSGLDITATPWSNMGMSYSLATATNENNIFVANSYFQEVMVLDYDSNQASTIKINTTGTLLGMVATNETLYISDGDKIHAVDVVTGETVSTFGTGTMAGARGLALDGDYLIICDRFNSEIDVWNISDETEVLSFGNATDTYYPMRVAVDADAIYVLDTNRQVTKWNK